MEVANRQLDCADHFYFTTVMTDKNSTAMCYDGEEGLLLWSRFKILFCFKICLCFKIFLCFKIVLCFKIFLCFKISLCSPLWGRTMGVAHLVCMTTNVGECFTPTLLLFNITFTPTLYSPFNLTFSPTTLYTPFNPTSIYCQMDQRR